MKPYILTVSLNPAVDKTVKVSKFKIGYDFREEAIFLSAGGKGINVSRVLKKLNTDNIAYGFLGGTSGAYIKKQLEKEGIKNDFAIIKGLTRTSFTVIDPELNTITRILERGPQVSKQELILFKKKFLTLFKNCQCVVLSGRNIPGAQDSIYAELIRVAKKKGIITILDTSAKPYRLGIREKPFMIKPNLNEAEDIASKKLDSFLKMKKFINSLHKKGIKIIALTLGSRGAIVSNQKELIFAQPPKLKRKSPVGCGDAFIAGFISSYLKHKTLKECVRMATACGAANALSINPGFIDTITIKKIYKQVNLRNLKAG